MKSLNPASAVQPPAAAQLAFSDVALLVAIAITFLIANDALLGLKLQQSFLKHVVGLAIACSCALYYVGAALNHSAYGQRLPSTNAIWLWLVSLGVFILAGSIYARIELGVQESFLIVGLYILVGYVFSRCLRAGNTASIAWQIAVASLAFSALVAVETIGARAANLAVRDTVIHEREFFVIPLLYVLVYTKRLPRLVRLAGTSLILVAAVAALKNTPVIVLALTSLVIWWRWQTSRAIDHLNPPKRFFVAYLLVVAALLFGAAYAYYVTQVRQFTPAGNIDFRQHQYLVAWNQFLASPLIGAAFTIETGIPFALWLDANFAGTTLPTHNDVLDLMRGGGLVALLLWLVPIAWSCGNAMRLLWRVGRERRWKERHDILAWLFLVNVSAVVVYTFNPILAKTAFAALVWIYFALLTAMVAILRADDVK